MYYYIMEPASKKGAAWQEKVKSILGDLGIAGETVTPSPARSIEELASLGLVKGYSTIVAVGSEKIVNKIVTAIINQKENKDVVLGVIPDDYESSLAKRIRVTNLRDACETLKYRKLSEADACFIEPNKYFLTEAVIAPNRSTEAYLITPQIKAGLPFDKITIKPGLEITIDDLSTEKTSGKKIFNWLFGKQEISNNSSYFHAKTFKIETINETLPILVDGETIAKTPIICHNRSRALKIIVARDTILTKE